MDGLAIGAWNSSNAEFLIQHTVNKGYTIHGWELGNRSYIFVHNRKHRFFTLISNRSA